MTQVALWTVGLVFGLLALLLLGRSPSCPAEAGEETFGSCPAGALASRVDFGDLLGDDFRWEYLFLLGWPLTVAITAKRQVLGALDEIDAATQADTDPAKPRAGRLRA
jgi:hypothetical protein